MARRVATIEADFPADPIAEVIREERSNTAGDLAEALESFRGVDHGNVKGILYKTARGGGKFEWIKEVYPPFDHNEIFTDLQKRFGGGDFQLRMMVNGKIATNINFSIVFDANAIANTNAKSDSGDMNTMMFQMMMEQSRESARQREEDRRDRQASSERMMTAAIGLAGVIAPLMLGGKDKTSELLGAIAAFQPRPQENDLEKTVNTFAALKTIFKDDTTKEGFNADDMVGSIVRAAGPIAGAVGKAFSGSRGGAAQEPEAPQLEGGAQPLRLPHNPAPPSGNEPEPTNQILRLIRPDVLYFFGRRHAPDLAAEAVYDVIVRAGITDEEINGTFAPYAFSDDKWNALAAEGIDLRADIAWADEFIAELAKLFMGGDADGDADDLAGAGGGEANADDHGKAVAKG